MFAGVNDLALWADFLDEEDAAILLGLDPGSEYGSLPPITFPATALRIRVELFLAGNWTDVSPYVLYEYGIRIVRGRRPTQRRADPGSCTLTFKNPDKRFSPRNVTGPWFGLLRSNTPLRVWVNPGDGDHLRFTGKVPSWVPEMRGHPDDRRVTVTAWGVLNRLERGDDPPLASAQYRYFSRQVGASGGLLAYDPLEGSGGGYVDGPDGSAQLPDLSQGGIFSGTIPNFQFSINPRGMRLAIDVKWPLGKGLGAGNVGDAISWNMTTDGAPNAIGGWALTADSTQWGLIGYYNDGVTTVPLMVAENLYDGLWHHIQVDMVQNSTQLDFSIYKDLEPVLGGGVNPQTVGKNTFWICWDDTPSLGSDRMPAVGHVAWYTWRSDLIDTAPPSYPAFTGHAGERPTERFLRLAAEEGITASVDELYQDVLLMGPQGRRSLPDLLKECESASDGLLYETLDNTLQLATARSRYNPAVTMRIDYATGAVLPPLTAADDDTWLRNDWTITRTGAGLQTGTRVQKLRGPNNVAEPEDDPLGIGRYDDSEAVNMYRQGDTLDVAGWRVFRDTVDDPRFPLIQVSLASSPELIRPWLACNLGSRLVIANSPDDLGPEDPEQTIEGYGEVLTQVSWEIGVFTEPASVYRATIPAKTYDASTPRLDCAASTLTAAVTAEQSVVDDLTTSVAAWTPTAATFVLGSSPAGRAGGLAGQLTTVGTPAQAFVRREAAVTAGQQYTALGWYFSAAGYANLQEAIDWYTDPGGVGYLSTTAPAPTALAAGAWESRTATGTAPAGARYAQYGPTLASNPPGGTLLTVSDTRFAAVLALTVTDNCVWSGSFGEFPVTVGGEDMLVIAASAAAGTYPARTQTLTVIRALNGAVLAHPAGAEVHVRYPIILAR